MKNVLFALLVALSISACGGESPTPPKDVKDIDSKITKVDQAKVDGKSVMRVTMKLNGLSASADVFSAGSEMLNISKEIVKYFPKQAGDEVHFVLVADLVDKYGNKSEAGVLEIPYATNELKKINFESSSFTGWNLLNLSQEVTLLHPVGREFIREFCKDESNAKYADTFCTNTINL
ncbi:hypothetical protein [Chromobacterium sp. IIBBL 290-4]|uniref:hypothetical protein n=1 Tax=Chromobacterium sp. IIBBL 290-4 TaxID=2953890 RepID=UPI0020B6F620|nr:hypothetical protein [Chromobacterium sp. IIBBL 290-4]UTH73957.1 hypothetical protein NKT35_20810 [Chromobacterium sp. IIBBL 290-4]